MVWSSTARCSSRGSILLVVSVYGHRKPEDGAVGRFAVTASTPPYAATIERQINRPNSLDLGLCRVEGLKARTAVARSPVAPKQYSNCRAPLGKLPVRGQVHQQKLRQDWLARKYAIPES